MSRMVDLVLVMDIFHESLPIHWILDMCLLEPHFYHKLVDKYVLALLSNSTSTNGFISCYIVHDNACMLTCKARWQIKPDYIIYWRKVLSEMQRGNWSALCSFCRSNSMVVLMNLIEYMWATWKTLSNKQLLRQSILLSTVISGLWHSSHFMCKRLQPAHVMMNT